MEMQRGPWEDFQQRPPAPVGMPQPVIPREATPQTPESRRNTVVNTQRTGQTIQQSATGGHNFSDENSLRSQFQGLPEVRNYQSVAPMVQSALHAAPGGAGDLNIVYGFAKVMDPGSVVREGEVQMSQGTGSLGEQIQGYIQRIRSGGSLPPSVRQRLLREIQTRAEAYRAPYQQYRKQYWSNAERYGFDPEAIVGNDIDAAYQSGPNAPLTASAPGAPAPADTPSDVPPWLATAVPQALSQIGPQGPGQGPSINAPGAPTAADPRESALRSTAVAPEIDNTGTATNPQFATPQDIAYNEAWASAVNSGADLATLNRWLADNYAHFYPGAPPPTVSDDQWAIIEHSRRTGSPLQWEPNRHGVRDLPETIHTPVGDLHPREGMEQQYRDQADRARGAEDRAAWAEEHPILSRVDTAVRQGANTLTLGTTDRIAGLISGRGAAYEHGVTQNDWQDRPLESIGGTVLGGSRLPYGVTLPRQIGLGTAYGGVTSFNEDDGSFTNRLGGAYRGAAGGLAANTLLGGLGRAFRAPNAPAIMEAGERQGVTIPRYMLGRETAQVATGAVGATPGRIPLAGAARETMEGIESARNRAAAEIGNVGDNISAGRRAQAGARAFLDNSEERATQLYNRIPIPPRTRADLTNTRAVLAETTEGLESNPALSAILEDPQLIQFRDALTEGGLSWRDLKTFRTRVGRMIGRAQVAGQGTHIEDLQALYGGLTRDMEATATAQGGRALTMFRRATQYWRGREDRREGVIQTILGRNFNESPEDAYRQINRWAQRDNGDIRALTQTMRSLPADDANAVRATIFARMGRATRGQQDETGEAFSPFVFATQWSGLEPRAKSLLVPNAAHRRNLDDIALLATTMRRSERFTNTSNTGLGTNLGLFTVGGIASPGTAVGAFGLTYTLGRLLSTPAGSRTFLRALRDPVAFQQLLQDAQGSGEDSGN